VVAVAWGIAVAPAVAAGTAGFGLLSGPNGCLVASGKVSSSPSGCGDGKGLVGAGAVAASPDGANVYVASGVVGNTDAQSFGSVAILKRDAATGAISEVGCLSSDGTDGRDGASGGCTPTPSLLGADGVAVSPDGSTVFVTASYSGAVVAFKRDPATGLLARLGCFQFRPPAGSGCPAANVFSGSAAVVAGAGGADVAGTTGAADSVGIATARDRRFRTDGDSRWSVTTASIRCAPVAIFDEVPVRLPFFASDAPVIQSRMAI